MPFASDKQRRFMFSQHPEIAKRFAAEGKANVEPSKHPIAKAMKVKRARHGK